MPVCPDGETRKVTRDNVDEYANLVLKTRTKEASKQLKALKDGFNIIFPVNKLITLTWKDLEEKVRGPSEISVADLKSITDYSNCNPQNEYIQRFWRVFSTFTNQQKSMFLKFVWGRDRMPSVEDLGSQKFKIVLFEESKSNNHDGIFPEAHTCFFQVNLPRYTTDGACKSKTLYAIETCGSIDTDFYVNDRGSNRGYDSDFDLDDY